MAGPAAISYFHMILDSARQASGALQTPVELLPESVDRAVEREEEYKRQAKELRKQLSGMLRGGESSAGLGANRVEANASGVPVVLIELPVEVFGGEKRMVKDTGNALINKEPTKVHTLLVRSGDALQVLSLLSTLLAVSFFLHQI